MTASRLVAHLTSGPLYYIWLEDTWLLIYTETYEAPNHFITQVCARLFQAIRAQSRLLLSRCRSEHFYDGHFLERLDVVVEPVDFDVRHLRHGF